MFSITKVARRERARQRCSPVVVQQRMTARGLDVAPDTLALRPGQTYCGKLGGFGPPMKRGVRLALERPAGTQWIFVPSSIAEQCAERIGAALLIRRDRRGRYKVMRGRDRSRCSVIDRRQIIADEDAQSEEVKKALCESIEIS